LIAYPNCLIAFNLVPPFNNSMTWMKLKGLQHVENESHVEIKMCLVPV